MVKSEQNISSSMAQLLLPRGNDLGFGWEASFSRAVLRRVAGIGCRSGFARRFGGNERVGHFREAFAGLESRHLLGRSGDAVKWSAEIGKVDQRQHEADHPKDVHVREQGEEP